MADISVLKVGDSSYSIKDSSARSSISNLETTISSALKFKGTAATAAAITGLTNYKAGDTYKATAAFTITGVGKVESGDMIICISAYSSSYKASDWTVVQNNIDTMTGSDGSTAGSRGLVPAPASGDNNKFLKGDGTWASTDLEWGSIASLIS